MKILKQSATATLVLGPFVDSTDGFTAETALSIAQADVRLSKNAGTFAQKSDTTSASHMENGYYSVPLNTTDTGTLGRLNIGVTKSGALPVFVEYTVVPANVYESLVAGSEYLEVSSLKPVWAISGTTLSVKKTDGSTNQYTRTLTTDAAAVPIIGAA
jgi:hypothetical protein